MSAKDEAYKDWLAGMKYKEIAEKHGVSLSAVKSWATRSWKKEKDATTKSNQSQTKNKKLRPKKTGAPFGNRNAAGHHDGAPKRNQNAVKHGAYCKVFDDLLTDEERALVDKMGLNKLDLIREEVQMLTIRERRLMAKIAEYKEIQSGIAVQSLTKDGIKTTTTAVTTFEFIKVLESELTKVQRVKSMNIRLLIDLVGDDDEKTR